MTLLEAPNQQCPQRELQWQQEWISRPNRRRRRLESDTGRAEGMFPKQPTPQSAILSLHAGLFIVAACFVVEMSPRPPLSITIADAFSVTNKLGRSSPQHPHHQRWAKSSLFLSKHNHGRVSEPNEHHKATATATTAGYAGAGGAFQDDKSSVRSPRSPSATNSKSSTTSDTVGPSLNTLQKKLSARDVEQMIVSAGRKGRTDAALQLFYNTRQGSISSTSRNDFWTDSRSTMTQPKRTIRHVNAVIDACARARPVRLSQALAIVDSLTKASTSSSASSSSHLQPNVYTYGALMNAMSRAGKVHMAVDLLESLTKSTSLVRPNAVVYQSAIMAAANAEPPRPDIALRILQQAESSSDKVALTVVGYNAAITAAARAADWKLAVDLLRRMQPSSSSSSISNTNTPSKPSIPKPDAVTYGTVMAACEKCGEWRQVLQFANEMQQLGFELDGVAITSVLHACQQFGLSSMAVQYLHRMKTQLASSSPQYTRHTAGRERVGSKQALFGPDAVAYRLTISACARGGAWQEGLRILDEYCAVSDGVNAKDVVAYTAAMYGCEVAGKWNEAMRLLGRMRSSGAEPNEVTFTAVIGACAKACANLELTATAGTATTSVSSDGANSSKPNEINESESSMPLPLRKALQILNVMRKDVTVVNPNIQVYNAAIRACAEGLDVNRAFQLLPMIRDDGLEPNIITYGTLMTACQRVGNVNGMTRVFQLLRDDGLVPNEIIYGAALSCCRKAGEAERAFLLLRKMIREGLQPNIATFNTVLLAQIEGKSTTKDLDRALLVFQMLTDDEYDAAVGAKPNRQTHSILIKALATNKRPLDAESVLQLMRAKHDMVADVELYTATISSYERIGQPLNALRLMESMRADGYDFYEVEVLNTLFKRVVKLANAVGQTLSKTSEPRENAPPATSAKTPSIWNETSIA